MHTYAHAHLHELTRSRCGAGGGGGQEGGGGAFRGAHRLPHDCRRHRLRLHRQIRRLRNVVVRSFSVPPRLLHVVGVMLSAAHCPLHVFSGTLSAASCPLQPFFGQLLSGIRLHDVCCPLNVVYCTLQPARCLQYVAALSSVFFCSPLVARSKYVVFERNACARRRHKVTHMGCQAECVRVGAGGQEENGGGGGGSQEKGGGGVTPAVHEACVRQARSIRRAVRCSRGRKIVLSGCTESAWILHSPRLRCILHVVRCA